MLKKEKKGKKRASGPHHLGQQKVEDMFFRKEKYQPITAEDDLEVITENADKAAQKIREEKEMQAGIKHYLKEEAKLKKLEEQKESKKPLHFRTDDQITEAYLNNQITQEEMYALQDKLRVQKQSKKGTRGNKNIKIMFQSSPSKEVSPQLESSKKMSQLLNSSNFSVLDVMNAEDDLPEKKQKKTKENVKSSGKKQTKLQLVREEQKESTDKVVKEELNGFKTPKKG